ncbi:hypothetical protein ACWGPT_02415 [Pseudorhizobium sp. NPDC055634]
MQDHHFNGGVPGIFAPEDLDRMGVATAAAIARLADEDAPVEKEAIARVVLRFYRRGLVDPNKLTDAAVMVAHSKLFQRVP